MEITPAALDQRQSAYKIAADAWKQSMQHEEDFALVEHSVADLDRWEQAAAAEDSLRKQAKEAKKLYEDGLRSKFFGFHEE